MDDKRRGVISMFVITSSNISSLRSLKYLALQSLDWLKSHTWRAPNYRL